MTSTGLSDWLPDALLAAWRLQGGAGLETPHNSGVFKFGYVWGVKGEGLAATSPDNGDDKEVVSGKDGEAQRLLYDEGGM